jgi:hypothetical protein
MRPGTFFNVMSKSADGTPSRRGFPMYQLPQIMELSSRVHRDDDFYISQAAFNGRSGCATNFASINSLFVDLDTYRSSDRGADSPEQILAGLESIGMPEPSYIVSSGRGAYLKYILEDRIYSERLPEWTTAQRALVTSTAALHADQKVKDCSRILRTLGSVNRTSGGKRVSVVWQSGRTFRFDRLSREIGQVAINALDAPRAYQPAVRRSRKTREAFAALGQVGAFPLSALENLAARHEPIIFSSAERTPQSLAWCRFLDLKDLVVMRGGISEGERTTFMLWMLNFLAQARTVRAENFYDEVAEIASMMPGENFDPVKEGSMQTLFRRVELLDQGKRVRYNGQSVDPTYRPSNDFLIETFRIEPAEQRTLRTLLSRDVVSERRTDKRRAAGMRPMVEVVAERQAARADAATTARGLAEEGFTAKVIAERMDVTIRTIRRYLAGDGSTARKSQPKLAEPAAPIVSQDVTAAGRRNKREAPCAMLRNRRRRPVSVPVVRLAAFPLEQQDAITIPGDAGAASTTRHLDAQLDVGAGGIASFRSALLSRPHTKAGATHARAEILVNPNAFATLKSYATTPRAATHTALVGSIGPASGAPVAGEPLGKEAIDTESGGTELRALGATGFGGLSRFRVTEDDALSDGGSGDPDRGAEDSLSAEAPSLSPAGFRGLQPQDEVQMERLRALRERAGRNVRNQPAFRQTPAARLDEPTSAAPEWTDDERPPGSTFTLEQWNAAREQHPDCCIFEFHAASERSASGAPILMAIPHGRLEAQGLPAQMLDGSLVAAGDFAPPAGSVANHLIFNYPGTAGGAKSVVMKLFMRAANPWSEMMKGSRVELALGENASDVMDSARTGRTMDRQR